MSRVANQEADLDIVLLEQVSGDETAEPGSEASIDDVTAGAATVPIGKL